MPDWLSGYRRRQLPDDAIGAATAWALIVPESVAYAQIAGVPAQCAFYAAPVALLAYALAGSSRFLIVGATSAAALLSGATVSSLTHNAQTAAALSAALALTAGALLIAAGLCRAGFLAHFLDEPVLVGFLFGMALTIMVRQLPKLTGVSTGPSTDVSTSDGTFFVRLWHVLAKADAWSWTALAVGASAIAALLLLERLLPRLPAALIVLAAGIAVSAAAHLDRHGVKTVGRIPRAVPAPAWPQVPLHAWVGLGGGAAGVALICFAEGFSIAGGLARKHGDGVDAGRELAALGAANAAAGLFHGFAVSGSASRSAAAEAAGGTSRMVSVLAAALVLITGAFLTPLFTDLPEPVLGALVVVAVRRFLNTGELARYWGADRAAFAVASSALLGVLVFDLLPGLVLAVLLGRVLLSRARGPRGRPPAVAKTAAPQTASPQPALRSAARTAEQ